MHDSTMYAVRYHAWCMISHGASFHVLGHRSASESFRLGALPGSRCSQRQYRPWPRAQAGHRWTARSPSRQVPFVLNRVLGRQRLDSAMACILFLRLLPAVYRRDSESVAGPGRTHDLWIDGLTSFLAVCFDTRGHKDQRQIPPLTNYSELSRS